jgi:hypothetical protein
MMTPSEHLNCALTMIEDACESPHDLGHICSDCGEWSSVLIDGACPGCLYLRDDREARM